MGAPFTNVPLEQQMLIGGVFLAAPAADATLEIPKFTRLVRVTTPASGVGIVRLPSADEMAGWMIVIKALNTGGGEVKVTLKGGTTDAVGDNLSAAADVAILLSDGEKWHVIKDVTT